VPSSVTALAQTVFPPSRGSGRSRMGLITMADLRAHDGPILLITMLRSWRSRWPAARAFALSLSRCTRLTALL
jgi:hypothetical protein